MKKALWIIPLVVLLLFYLGRREKPYTGPHNTFTLTDTAFAAEIAATNTLVAVDFWAPWCGPCRRVGPVLEKLAGEYEGRMRIGKLNTDDYPALAEKYQVTGIPTIILFQRSKVLDRRSGVASETDYRAWFDGFLKDTEASAPGSS